MPRRRHISTRERVKIFEREKGICHFCDVKIFGEREDWDVSHEIPLELGGDDEGPNLRVAHRKCHKLHTAKVDAPAIAKSRRVRAKHMGAKAPSRNPLPGGKQSKWKQKIGGGWVLRDSER
jgi:5-methylcytosine-specific restriction endonuclease McrA